MLIRQDYFFVTGESSGSPDGIYTSGGASRELKYPQSLSMSVVEVPQLLQSDNANPFDFPQGSTTYSTTTGVASVHLRGGYHDQVHLQYSLSSAYSVDTELSSSLASSGSTNTTTLTNPTAPVSTTNKNTLLPSTPSQMYMDEMPYHQQRWQQHSQIMSGGEFYLQQSLTSASACVGVNNVMMMPQTAQGHGQQQYYMSTPPGSVPSQLQQQPVPTPQTSHSRAHPALL